MRRSIIEFEKEIVWKALFVMYKQPSGGALNTVSVSESEVESYIETCDKIGRRIDTRFAKPKTAFKEFTPQHQELYVRDLISDLAGLLPLPQKDRGKHAIEMARCILKYFGVRSQSLKSLHKAKQAAINVFGAEEWQRALYSIPWYSTYFTCGEEKTEEMGCVVDWGREQHSDFLRSEVKRIIARDQRLKVYPAD